MDVTLPTRTAGEVTLSDGTKVWLKTLNALQRAEAQSRAELYAVREARPWRRGNEGWQAAVEEFTEWAPERQADYLAAAGDIDGAYAEQADRRVPEPPRPERPPRPTKDEGGRMKDEGSGIAHPSSLILHPLCSAAYADLLETWEAACERAAAARLELMERLRQEAWEQALALTASERLEACAQEGWRRTYSALFGTRMMLEAIFRAARRPEERSRLRFADVEEVADLCDTDSERLLNTYLELDCVRPVEIPTTPPGS